MSRVNWFCGLVVVGIVVVAFPQWALVGEPEGCLPTPIAEFTSDLGSEEAFQQFTEGLYRHRMRIVPDPDQDRARNVLLMESSRDDTHPSGNPRAQLSTPGGTLVECAEFWAQFSLYVPSMSAADRAVFRADRSPQINYAQVYGPPFGGPAPLVVKQVFDKEAGRPYIALQVGETHSAQEFRDLIWRTALSYDTWMTFAIHMRMSTDPEEGFVRLYFDAGTGGGLQRQRFSTGTATYRYPTLTEANHGGRTPGGNRFDLQVYRSARLKIPWVRAYFADVRLVNNLEPVPL